MTGTSPSAGKDGNGVSPDRGDFIREVRRITFAGMFVNIALTVLKGAGGVVFHSQALVADAVHSLSDLVTDFAVIFGVKYWSAPPDESHPYGHGKIETVISAFIGVALTIVAIGLTLEAVDTLRSKTESVPMLPAFVIAVLSIVSKEILFRWTRSHARRLDSPAIEANAWHHRSDAISSIPVAVAIAVAYFFPELHWIDPVGAILVSFFILHAAWLIIKPTLFELTESGSVKTRNEIRRIASSLPEVKAVHAVRTRNIGSSYLTDLHVMVDPELTVRQGHAIAHRIMKMIFDAKIGVNDIVVHIEPYEIPRKNTKA